MYNHQLGDMTRMNRPWYPTSKVPPKLSIDVAKSKKAHVEEEMEITEEPLPTAGKGKGSITSPSSKGKEKGTTSTSSKTKKPAPEEEEAAKPTKSPTTQSPKSPKAPKHPVTLHEEEEEAVPAAKPTKSPTTQSPKSPKAPKHPVTLPKNVSIASIASKARKREREVEPQQAGPSSSTRHVTTRRMAEAEGEESAEEPHAETEESPRKHPKKLIDRKKPPLLKRHPWLVESGNIGRSVKNQNSQSFLQKALAIVTKSSTKDELLSYARAVNLKFTKADHKEDIFAGLSNLWLSLHPTTRSVTKIYANKLGISGSD
ncbi:hypothetical protein BC829DRAFT_421824 [Chytridium lagenaria]|nr:hypothetical protein BC829DRAFT_421824 [Chytridium lagenaria]